MKNSLKQNKYEIRNIFGSQYSQGDLLEQYLINIFKYLQTQNINKISKVVM